MDRRKNMLKHIRNLEMVYMNNPALMEEIVANNCSRCLHLSDCGGDAYYCEKVMCDCRADVNDDMTFHIGPIIKYNGIMSDLMFDWSGFVNGEVAVVFSRNMVYRNEFIRSAKNHGIDTDSLYHGISQKFLMNDLYFIGTSGFLSLVFRAYTDYRHMRIYDWELAKYVQ